MKASIEGLPRVPLVQDEGTAWAKTLKEHKLNTEEYARLKGILGRAPTLCELGVFSAMWSEHCSYKSSRVHLKRLPTEGPNVVVGPGENAGVVRLHGKICVAFKMESHNHPSYIEPYQGAATGVGGILRDVFCMGARPIANLNCLRFGAKEHAKTAHLVEYVTKGIGDYGNCVGIPTVGGNMSFDHCYDGNCLVNAFTAGLIHEDRIFKGYATGEGNLIVYVGSATGRDGIHGATMASDSFVSEQTSSKSTVQVGDPFAEKLLLEVTLESLELGLVIGLQDMGAAGLTSSSFEMAGRAGNGIVMDLGKVPVRAPAMTAYEILLSESQERMLMVVTPANWQALETVLQKWGLHYAVIGHVTGTGRVQIVYDGKVEVDVPVDPLTEQAPRYERPMRRDPVKRDPLRVIDSVTKFIKLHGINGTAERILAASGWREPVFQQYDQHIGYRTVMNPRQEGAAVMWIHSDWEGGSEMPHLGMVVSSSCNERYCQSDSKLGAAHAVTKAARMIAATGGIPLAATDCLNYGNPEDPIVMAQFSDGVDGIGEACRALEVPVVSGNVSLYNETDGKSIFPTPMIGMVGRHNDVRRAIPAVIRSVGPIAILLPKRPSFSFGASLIGKLAGLDPTSAAPPAIDYEQESEAFEFLQECSAQGWLGAARDVGEGGIATTLIKMGYESGLEIRADLTAIGLSQGPEERAFAELAGAYILQFKDPVAAEQALAKASTMRYGHVRVIGEVQIGSGLTIEGIRLESAALVAASRRFLSFN